MKFGERIKALLAEKNISQADLARMVGVSKAAVSNWTSGGDNPTLDRIYEIASALDVQPARLVQDEFPAVIPPGHVRIPIYDVSASAGHGCFNDSEHVETFITLREAAVRQSFSGSVDKLALLSVVGDSMAPWVQSGEMVIVDRTVCELIGDGVYVLRMEGVLYVKRLQKHPDGGVTVVSDNPAYPPIRVSTKKPPQDFAIMGRVVAAISMKKA